MSHYVTLCHTMSHYATLCHTMSHYVTLCHTMPHYVTLSHCRTVSHCVTLCHTDTKPHYVTLYHTKASPNVTLCHTVRRCPAQAGGGTPRGAACAASTRRTSWARVRAQVVTSHQSQASCRLRGHPGLFISPPILYIHPWSNHLYCISPPGVSTLCIFTPGVSSRGRGHPTLHIRWQFLFLIPGICDVM